MPKIETSMTDAAKAVNLASDTYGSTNALYKKAAAIASYKLGRACPSMTSYWSRCPF